MTIVSANPKVRRTTSNFHPVFDGILNDFFNGPITGKASPKPVNNRPATNITEEKDSYLIELAVPGLTKEDINIELDKALLKVSARKAAPASDEERIVKKEFSYFGFERSFKLPETVDPFSIGAKVENGILQIALPKKEEAVERGPVSINIA